MIEATGRYEHLLADAALARDMPVIIVNPLHVRRYAGAVGQLAKTDKIDARVIAEYAAIIQPELRPACSQNVRVINDLLARRRQLLSMRRTVCTSCRRATSTLTSSTTFVTQQADGETGQ